MTWSTLFQLLFSGIAIGAVYGLIALSYNAIFNTSSIINFSQGELVMLGGVVGYSFYVTSQIPLVLALIFSALVVAAIALLVERIAVRPVKETGKNFIWIMSTFGFGITLKELTSLILGTQPLPFPKFIGGEEPIHWGGVSMLPQEIGTIVIALLLTAAYVIFMRETIFGTAVRATAQDRETAGLMGIDARKVIYFSYAISGAIATLAGFLVSPISFADPQMGILLGVKGFIALIIGGLGNVVGGFIGGIFLGLLENLASAVFQSIWKDVIVFGCLIVVMIVKPSGFFSGIGKASK